MRRRPGLASLLVVKIKAEVGSTGLDQLAQLLAHGDVLQLCEIGDSINPSLRQPNRKADGQCLALLK